MRKNLTDDTLLRAGSPLPLEWRQVVGTAQAAAGRHELTDDQAATVAWWWRNDGPEFDILAQGYEVRFRDLADAIHHAWLRADNQRGGFSSSRYPNYVLDDRLCLDMLSTWALNGSD